MRTLWLCRAFCPKIMAALEEEEQACGREERRKRRTGRKIKKKG